MARRDFPRAMAELGASNAEIVAELRANAGKVSGFFEHDSLLLLTTTGRKSGKPHTIPLSYIEDDGQLVVIGANLTSEKISDWYLLADPRVVVEVDNGRFMALASTVKGDRRDRILDRIRAAWEASRAEHPELPELPVREDGTVPVVALRRV